MRPTLNFLSDELIEKIIGEARELICKLGVEIHNENAVSLLVDHGAKVDRDKQRVFFTDDIIDTASMSMVSTDNINLSLPKYVDFKGYDFISAIGIFYF